jgi:hypothetical protein
MRPRNARTAPKLLIKRNADGRSFVDGINIQVSYSEDDIKQFYAYFQKKLSFNFCATSTTCYEEEVNVSPSLG